MPTQALPLNGFTVIDLTAHRFAPDRYAHVPERGAVSHGEREPIVGPITVFLREYVGPAWGVGGGANHPTSGAP